MPRLRLAWIHVRAQLGQLLAAVAVIALGVGLAGGLLLANDALLESARASTDALAGRTDVQVRTVSGGSLDETLLERVRAVQGVEAAAPLIVGSVSLAGADGADGGRISIVGVDMLDDATIRVYRSPVGGADIEDPLMLLAQPDSVIAPAAFASAQGLSRGDRVAVDAPGGRRQLVVRGLLVDVDLSRAFGGRFLVTDLYAAQDLLAMPGGVSQIDLVLDPTVDRATIVAALRAALPPHVVAEPIAQRQGSLERTVAGLGMMLNVIAAMGLALGTLITANRLATLYQERLWEIGVLRGMGWTPARLMADLLLEAAGCSALAVLLGVPLAYVLARAMVQPVADLLSLNYAQTLAAPEVTVRPLPLALAALAGIFAGVAAAAWPAYRATQTSIATLGSRRRGRDPSPDRAWVRRARYVTPIVAVALLVASRHSGVLGGLAMVALALSGVLLLRPLLRTVGLLVGRLFGPVAVVGLYDQSRGSSRPAGAAAVLMVGVALVVWIATTGASFERFVVDTNMSTRRGDLILDGAVDMPATGESEPRLSEEILRELAETPGVAAVGAETYATSHDPEVGVVAVDAIRLRLPRFADWHLESGAQPDALERVASGEAVLADANFARNNQLRVGDVVRLTSPTGLLSLPLAGITKPTFVSPAGDVVVERGVYRDAWHDPTINRAFVMVADGASVADVRQRILETIGKRYRVRVTDMQTHASWIADSVRRGFAFSDAMAMVTLVVVLLGTGDALAANVGERRREIATLRGMGYRPRDVARMVLAQAIAVGVSGSVLAVVVGMAMSIPFVEVVLPQTLGWQLELYPTYGVAAGVAVLGVLASAVGAIVPAIRASRIPVATALRYE